MIWPTKVSRVEMLFMNLLMYPFMELVIWKLMSVEKFLMFQILYISVKLCDIFYHLFSLENVCIV